MPNTAETWLDSFIVNTTTSDTQKDPVITQLANGNILVVWTSTVDTGEEGDQGDDLVGQIFDPLGNMIGGEIQLNTNRYVDDENNPSIAALPNGGFVVVFEDNDNGVISLRLETYDQDGSFLESPFFEHDGSTDFPNFNDPVVAASSNTSVMVAYEKEVASGDVDIYFRIYNPDTNTFGDETALFTNSDEYGSLDITVLSNGNYVIVTQNTNADNAISMRIITPTGSSALSNNYVGLTNANGDVDKDPSVAALTGGGFVVSWTNKDTDQDVQFQVYTDAGMTVGGVRTVHGGGGTDKNNESVVVALNDGGFMVIYDDDEAGKDGVKAQRYDATGSKVGSKVNIANVDASQIEATLLEDGRIAITYKFEGNIYMEIIDVRDDASATGVSSSDYVVGTIGDDDLVGHGPDFETVSGWDGDDTLGFGAGGLDTGNTFDGGEGNDTFDFTAFTGDYDVNLSTGVFERVAGGSVSTLVSIENISAGGGDDILTGDNGDNVLKGNDGNDILEGGKGKDTLKGGAGADTLKGGGGKDTLKGGTGADILKGGNGADILKGNGGSDTLSGGKGDDELVGGGGADVFVFAANDGHDTITDFKDGTDKLDLSAFGFASKAQAKSYFTEVGTSSDDYVQFDFFGTTIEIYGLDLGDINNSDIII